MHTLPNYIGIMKNFIFCYNLNLIYGHTILDIKMGNSQSYLEEDEIENYLVSPLTSS